MRASLVALAQVQTIKLEFRGYSLKCRHLGRSCAGTKKPLTDVIMSKFTREAHMPICFEDLVGEVMTARPATIRIFLDFRMSCVGCPIAGFHSVDDACKEHGIDRDKFLAALGAAANAIMA